MKWVIVDTQNYGNGDINWYYKGKGESVIFGIQLPEYTKDVKKAKIFNSKKKAYAANVPGKIQLLREGLKND